MPAPDIPLKTTGKVDTALLDYDSHNPRLIQDGDPPTSEAQVIRSLADTADLSELVDSIAANGYIDIEPLIVRRDGNRYRVLEGNRRLAAIRLLLNPELAKGTGVVVPKISKEVRATLGRVTVYAVASADDAREFIGFKHINGPHRWDALAKGRFAADWFRKERKKGVTLEKIAQRLGDRHDTVVRLVNGIFVMDQAEQSKAYDLKDRFPGRKFAFSHLYTALTRAGYRDFLGLPPEWRGSDPNPDPVPKTKLENLGTVMVWLYGSKSDNLEPVITSQNPHIKQLSAVLMNSRARSIMLMRNNLREAYAEVESRGARFEAALINAKQEAESALSQVIGFDPTDSTLLEIGKELRETSDRLYSNMQDIAKEAQPSAGKK